MISWSPLRQYSILLDQGGPGAVLTLLPHLAFAASLWHVRPSKHDQVPNLVEGLRTEDMISKHRVWFFQVYSLTREITKSSENDSTTFPNLPLKNWTEIQTCGQRHCKFQFSRAYSIAYTLSLIKWEESGLCHTLVVSEVSACSTFSGSARIQWTSLPLPINAPKRSELLKSGSYSWHHAHLIS